MSERDDYVTQRWSKYFDEIDREIAQLAVVLDVRILDPGSIERVLKNDASVCGRPQDPAFQKLRALLSMHFSTRAKAIEALGPEDALRIVHQTVARLRARIGDSLGNPGGG